MSDTYDEYDDDAVDDTDEKPERTNAEWAELRRAKKERDNAKNELAKMKREAAFMRAGIDPTDQRLSYFVKGYEGETTPDAIRAEAIKAGFLQPEGAQDQGDPADIEAQNRVQVAAGGLGADQPDLASAALDAAFKEGGQEGLISYLQQQGVPVNFGQ